MPGPDKLSLIVFSGDYDRVHYALITASAAAATDRQVTLFFTMGATRALLDTDADGAPGAFHLGLADAPGGGDHLALQVGEGDDVVIDHPDGADAGGGEVEQ